MNPVHTTPSYLSKIRLNIIHTGHINKAHVKENQLLSTRQVICNLPKHVNWINIFTLL
jgi:hypothetical protein